MNRYAHGGSLTKIEKQEEGREDVTLYVFSRYRVPDSFDGVAGAMLAANSCAEIVATGQQMWFH